RPAMAAATARGHASDQSSPTARLAVSARRSLTVGVLAGSLGPGLAGGVSTVVWLVVNRRGRVEHRVGVAFRVDGPRAAWHATGSSDGGAAAPGKTEPKCYWSENSHVLQPPE